MSSARPPSPTAFLEGGGRMGALMRSRDWTASPLGPPASWPDTLKVAVATCLHSNFPMVIWWGPDLLMLYNDAWQPILGDTKHPSGLGRPGAESWPETWPIVGVQFENALKGAASWSEDLLLASDRRGFLEECYFTYSHSPLMDAFGEVVGVCSVVNETTSRVLNERRLRVLRDLSSVSLAATGEPASLRTVCETLIDRLCLANPDVPFAIQYVADAGNRVHLYAAAGIDNGLFPPVVSADEADDWGIAEAVRSRTPVTIDVSSRAVRFPGGAWPEPTTQIMSLPLSRPNRPADACGVLLVGLNPRLRLDEPYTDFLRLVAAQLANAVSAIHLWEDERLARADAERAARVKDEFLALLSHELRNPLNAVLSWTTILKEGLLDPARISTALDVIERNVRQQERLISDLLDVRLLSSGTLRFDVEPVDLRRVTEEAIEAVSLAAVAKSVTLQPRLGAQACVVQGDGVRLQQVVRNLLANAIKFTPSGGTVEIMLTAEGGLAQLRIADTGEGIDPLLMPDIFDGFRQGDASRARRHGGLGLGLTIVKQFVEAHGGRVKAVSQGRGQGSTFTVELPYAGDERLVAPQPASAAAEAVAQTPGTLRDTRILVIDDNRDTLTAMQELIENQWAQVRTASSAQQALDILSRETFDVIVSDLVMPGVDGYTLITEIRRRGSATPAVALTALADADNQQRAMAAGYQAHIAKPVDFVELMDALVRLAHPHVTPSGIVSARSD